MRYRFFTIPVADPGPAQDEMDAFLASHRILSVEKEFVADGRHSLWCLCVAYLDSGQAPAQVRKGSIDYREVLSRPDFEAYARLRGLRKELAERDGTPAYAVFNNEQLAEMVRRRVSSKAELAAIEGVGKARVERYGDPFIEALRLAWAEQRDETRPD